MKYHKVQDIAEALTMIEQGRKLILSQGKYYLQDPEKKDDTWNAYLPADLRDELQGLQPELFEVAAEGKKEKIRELSPPDGSEKTNTAIASLTSFAPDEVQEHISESGGSFIKPIEFVLHDTARRILESVCVLERLHTIKDIDRHEMPFAFVGLDAKGNPIIFDKHREKGDTLLSLADLAVYLLIDRYMKYQKADETIISLNVEKTLLYNAYMNEKEKRKELEEALMLKILLKV